MRTDVQTDRRKLPYLYIDRQTDRQTNREADKQRSRQTVKQTNQEADKPRRRQTDRQAHGTVQENCRQIKRLVQPYLSP